MQAYNWYSQLIKPSWSPPAWLFGPVWTLLYVLIFVSFGKVFLMAWQKRIPWAVTLPFILNLVFNLIFTYIQFGLKNNLLAGVDGYPRPRHAGVGDDRDLSIRQMDCLYPGTVSALGDICDHAAINHYLFKQITNDC